MENSIEKIIISDGTKDIEIYPLVELDRNNKHYIVYTNKLLEKLDKECVYIGEIVGNILKPVENSEIPDLESIWQSILSINYQE